MAPRSAGNTLSIVAFVLAALALGIFPIILGPAAIICAAVGMKRGERLANLALILGSVGMGAGFVIGVAVAML
jgi:hypothetical protein